MSLRRPQPKPYFLILYASETGQAKAISEEITEKACEYGLKPAHFCMSLTDKRFSIERETCVVFIVSTTGDGQPPETAIKFFRRLSRNSLRRNYLEKLNYTLLALGDSNYLKFAAFGRQLEHRLKVLSATSFYPTGYGDDAFGIETGVDPWINGLWPALHKQLGLEFVAKSFVDCYNLQNNLRSDIILLMDPTLQSKKSIEPEKTKCIAGISLLLKEIDLEKCHVPKYPASSYAVIYDKNNTSNIEFHPNESTLVVPASPLKKASLIAAKQLTIGEDVKETLELTFQFEDEILEYEPGDSFGFICPNDAEEVKMLLTCLDLLDVADMPANLILQKDTAKKKLPSHIPNLFTLRKLFSHHIEIRAVPKKILLRIFAEYATVEEEKSCLLFLSSQEGSDYFTDFIRQPSLSILDILLHFKSCKPPVEMIIEHMPPLKPRFYSVANSPLVDSKIFKIVFNVLKLKAIDGRLTDRKGVCTGWFHDLACDMLPTSSSNLADQMLALKLDNLQKSVYIYKRKNQLFKFPNDLKTSVIMVGPGTGIAPFIGYLQHREKLLQTASDEINNSETWLFYGCRYQKRDYLYREELKEFVRNGTLQHLTVSHSRDHSEHDSEPKYVHESIKLHAKQISDCIRSGGKIYVCGDAKHMVHDVHLAFIEAVKSGFEIKESEAKNLIESLQKGHRYLNDVWA